jgi:predicted helicase
MSKIFHASLRGLSCTKERELSTLDIKTTEWKDIDIESSNFYLFIPQNTDLLPEYKQGWKITDIFSQNGDPAPGLVTTHDQFAISWNKNEAIEKVEALLHTNTELDARSIFKFCSTDQWQYDRAKRELADRNWHKELRPILYRPFDSRWTVYNRNVAVHRRERVMNHMIAGNNLALSTTRSIEIGTWGHIFLSTEIIQHHTVSLKEVNYLFPLYLYPTTPGEKEMGITRTPNLSPEFLTKIERNLGYQPTPEAIFHYIYAIFHSPTYRSRYAEFLKIDFPRVPLTSDDNLFRRLGELGAELVDLHLMKSKKVQNSLVAFIEQGGSKTVDPGHPKYDEATQSVVINKQGDRFTKVPLEVWNFHVGGYQVLAKWLKDRKGRELSKEDIQHYRGIVVALSETIRVMGDIDGAIPSFPIQ